MKLINHVLEIRRLIQQAFDNRFSRMGLRAEAPVAAEELADEEHRQRRRHLDYIMQSHLEELGDYRKARQATINECVFTLFNRIAAIKVMESKELFPEIIRRRKENAGRSFEHNAWLENHPEERSTEREGLKHFLNDQFDRLGEHIPLYRRDYPYALMPTADELDEIIERFNLVEEDAECGENVWTGDDILGWLYENFNAVEKEALKASGEKTEYDRVSLQSQVYTPAWVVKFLVDNTLGKSYLEMYPESKIRERYKIANAPTQRTKQTRDVTTMRLLDPACGSGNFLIYAFSLFYDLYVDQMENYGKEYTLREIPKMIVEKNLYGVDLDERAAQITQIALFIKARDLGGHRSKWPEYTNVVSTHFFLPEYEIIKKAFNYDEYASWMKAYNDTARKIWEDLASAHKFGSLVRVREQLESFAPSEENHLLFTTEEMESLFTGTNEIRTVVNNLVDQWGKENHYSLTQSTEAKTFLDIISRRYDVVVANPPYTDSGDFGSELKEFVEANYKKPFKVNSNLYSCFIKRCCELAGEDGKVGMVNPPTFMYIKTFEDTRKFILEKTHINLFVEWGYLGMFSSFARVDSAMFMLEMNTSTSDSTFIKLNDLYEMKRKGVLFEAYDDYLSGKENDRVYTLPQAKLKGIKSYPFIYWISDEFREKFAEFNLEKYCTVEIGFITGKNEDALRLWWEETADYWKPYTKGGQYNKWYGNNWLKVDSKDDYARLRKYKSSHIPDILDCEGITYTGSGSKGVTFRYLEKDVYYDKGSNSLFPEDVFATLAILNSKLTTYSVNCLNPTVNVQPNDIKRLPFVSKIEFSDKLNIHSRQNVEIKKYLCRYSLVEPLFVESPLKTVNDIISSIKSFYNYENSCLTLILLNESIINDVVFNLYKLNAYDKQMVLEREGIPVGDYPVSREAKDAYREWLQSNSEFPASEEVMEHLEKLPEEEDLPKVTDFDTLYTNNREWEEFCIQHKMNPVEVWYQFSNANVLPPQRTQVLAFELLTDVIRTVLAKDDDGIIPLGERMGEERLAIRVEREFMERGYSSAEFTQVCHLLGCDLERYLHERFFQQLSDHLNLFMYLPKTPFIWHLTSGPHHAIELYVSIYRWSRDAAFRVRSIYIANREAAIRDRLNSLDTEKAEGRIEAAELREMMEELNAFRSKVDDLLASGYDPKLDDGVGKNIAPLQKRGMLSYEVLNEGQLKKYLSADW